MGRWQRLAGCALVAISMAMSADAATLHSLQTTDTARLPVARPEFPVPGEPNQLFYLQRSTNSNTVIYAGRYDRNGVLDARNPVSVYWRRYNTNGARKPLKAIEGLFAYGVNVTQRNAPGEFTVTPKPMANRPLLLRQTGPGKAEILAQIGGRTARLVYMYLIVDESSLVPAVVRISVYGTDVATGRALSETFAVLGGAVRP